MKLSILCSLCKTAITSVSAYYRTINGQPRGICAQCNAKPVYVDFSYNKEQINIQSIDAFHPSTKSKNDKNNKMRENIIGAIINQKVPRPYFENSEWSKLETQVLEYIRNLYISTPYTSYNKIECKHMGGRKYNYDFQIVITFDEQCAATYNVELKYNANTIDDTPQFVSPVKPSQYMIPTNPDEVLASYEEYYYDTHLQTLCVNAGIMMPSKDEYLAQIHGTEPKCVKPLQELYYKGCAADKHFTGLPTDIAFYELAKRVSKDSIKSYIDSHELNVELLNTYLQNSQSNKIYMLYSVEKGFAIQYPNMDDYNIINYEKKENKYVCTCKSGNKMNVLLRWKNGNGIAFPAFQIS